jgi:hypothetical protein
VPPDVLYKRGHVAAKDAEFTPNFNFAHYFLQCSVCGVQNHPSAYWTASDAGCALATYTVTIFTNCNGWLEIFKAYWTFKFFEDLA